MRQSDGETISFLYHGMSMYRVFVSGEKLFAREVSPDQFQCGDIAVVITPGKDSVVHRVIRVGAEEIQTMGDNNPMPDDPVRFDGDHTFYLVLEAESLEGKLRKVVNGARGSRKFSRNQRKMKVRRILGRILWAFEPCFFWRKSVDNSCKFGQDEVFYYRNKPVGRRYPDGRTAYLRWYLRIFYKFPAGE